MQGEFNFETRAEPGPNGLSLWRREREQALRQVGRANGLPLGRLCRIELAGGVVIEGPLKLAGDELLPTEATRDLHLKLQVGCCTFTQREIVALSRLE